MSSLAEKTFGELKVDSREGNDKYRHKKYKHTYCCSGEAIVLGYNASKIWELL